MNGDEDSFNAGQPFRRTVALTGGNYNINAAGGHFAETMSVNSPEGLFAGSPGMDYREDLVEDGLGEQGTYDEAAPSGPYSAHAGYNNHDGEPLNHFLGSLQDTLTSIQHLIHTGFAGLNAGMPLERNDDKGRPSDNSYDSSGSSDPTPPPRIQILRRKTRRGPRGDRNHLSDELRQFLKDRSLWACRGGKLPEQVDPEVLENFQADRSSGSHIVNEPPKLDWRSTMRKSDYNMEIIVILANEFHAKIKQDPPTWWENSCSLSEKQLVALIRERLDRQREVILKQRKEMSSDEILVATARVNLKKAQKMNRRRTRRSGTYERRERICAHFKDEHGEPWKSVSAVIEKLNACGMSDDETDEELSSPPNKTLRRRRLEWVSEDVTSLMHAIDTYKIPVAFGDYCGNRPLPRILQHRVIDSAKSRIPVPGLPVNFYDPEFLRRCNKVDRLRLDLRQDQLLPTLGLSYESERIPIK